MAEFFDIAVSFPTVVYSVLLLVIIAYWAVAILGVIGDGVFDVDGGDGDVGVAGLLGALGLGGVPVAGVVSLWVGFSWFTSFAVSANVGGGGMIVGSALWVGALVAGYVVTYLVVIPLRRLIPQEEPPPQRSDLVGRTCVVRTMTVDHEHGQADVTAVDGSSAIIQVRQTGDEQLTAGSSALIFDYDADGEFFWVAAAPSSIGPDL